MTSGGSSTTLRRASAPSLATRTSQKGSSPLETRSRTMGLSSATSNLTDLPPAALMACCSESVARPHDGNRRSFRGFLQQADAGDFDSFIESLAHVVDREGSASNGNQCFHLHARLGGRRDPGTNVHSIFAQAGGHINVREWERMTKRYP